MQASQKLAFIFEHCESKGYYPFERMLLLYKLLNTPEKFLFLKAGKYSEQLCAADLFRKNRGSHKSDT